jgi:hypothetical protein
MKTGAELIKEERLRQQIKLGWTSEHDRIENNNGELLEAARCYASLVAQHDPDLEHCWPWDAKYWNPSGNPIRDLVKAGALIAAEIDRLQSDPTHEGFYIGATHAAPYPEFKLGDKVVHDAIYYGKEVFTVVGIRKNELELEGDFSGGTHHAFGSAWCTREGVRPA